MKKAIENLRQLALMSAIGVGLVWQSGAPAQEAEPGTTALGLQLAVDPVFVDELTPVSCRPHSGAKPPLDAPYVFEADLAVSQS